MIKKDKLKHIIISSIGTILLFLGLLLFFNKTTSLITSPIIMFLIGLFKEVIYDKLLGKGKFEWLDIVSNIIGILLSIILLYFII